LIDFAFGVRLLTMLLFAGICCKSIDPNQVLTVTICRAYQRVLGRVDGRVVVKGRVFIHVLIGLVGFERAGHEHLECVLECGSISF
jgi:hypothetical protein